MSKSLGNVVDPRMVIEGGKNQKVVFIRHLCEAIYIYIYSRLFVFLDCKSPYSFSLAATTRLWS